jgi:hypothetical protein
MKLLIMQFSPASVLILTASLSNAQKYVVELCGWYLLGSIGEE